MLIYGGVHTRTLLLCDVKVADGLRPGQSRQWKDYPVRLPSMCPSKLYMCKVLDVKYCIAVSIVSFNHSRTCRAELSNPNCLTVRGKLGCICSLRHKRGWTCRAKLFNPSCLTVRGKQGYVCSLRYKRIWRGINTLYMAV